MYRICDYLSAWAKLSLHVTRASEDRGLCQTISARESGNAVAAIRGDLVVGNLAVRLTHAVRPLSDGLSEVEFEAK